MCDIPPKTYANRGKDRDFLCVGGLQEVRHVIFTQDGHMRSHLC